MPRVAYDEHTKIESSQNPL